MATTAHASARERTSQDVLRLIRGTSGVTRSELVTQTGLSASTITHAVAKLLAEGRIREGEAAGKGPGSGSGRPANRLEALPGDTTVGALDFGHQHVTVVIGDDLGKVIAERTLSIDVDRSPAEALESAADALTQLAAETGREPLTAIGLGIPGPVDVTSGTVRSTTILSNWDGMNPAAMATALLGLPAVADNDATLGAIGELRFGAGQRLTDFLYIKASHGVGAGMVFNGKPYRGWSGFAGEIGHTVIAGRPELCRCGNRGCLEAVVAIPSVRQQIAHTHPDLALTDFELSDFTDPVSQRILNEVGRTLGRVLADMCNLINPSAVIIGGELGSSGQALIDGVRSSIGRFGQPGAAAVVEVIPGALGPRAETLGALLLAGEVANA